MYMEGTLHICFIGKHKKIMLKKYTQLVLFLKRWGENKESRFYPNLVLIFKIKILKAYSNIYFETFYLHKEIKHNLFVASIHFTTHALCRHCKL